MKRFLGISFAAFIALIAFALFSGDATAGLRKNCHGKRCHGRVHRERNCHCGLFHRRHRRCHGQEAVCCESNCCESGACAGGACGGGEVITEEAAPTEAAPPAPAKKKGKKAKKSDA